MGLMKDKVVVQVVAGGVKVLVDLDGHLAVTYKRACWSWKLLCG